MRSVHVVVHGTRIAAAVACVLTSAGSAHAQSAMDVEEVIVTATRRTTLLRDTPETIQVLSADALNALGVNDSSDYFRMVPNLSQSDNFGPGSKRYAIRGINSGGEPLVVVYYDDIPSIGSPGQTLDPGGSQADVKLWDVERIEVLKGPQGTLYGNGSMGGTIRIISRKPDLGEFQVGGEAGVQTTKSGDESYFAKGVLNAPVIKDKLAVRLTAYNFDNGGYIDDVYLGEKNANDEHTWGGRLGIRFAPTDNLVLTSTTYYQDLETDANYELYENVSADTPASANLSRQPFYDKLWMTNLLADYEFKGARLSYSFSYQDREVERYGDQTRFIIYSIFRRNPAVCTEAALRDRSCLATVPGSFVPLNSWASEKTKAQIHELRLTSGTEGRLRWTAGMYYENRDTTRWGQVAETTDDGVLRFDSTGKAIGRIFARLNNGDRRQWALFGEADYEVVPGVTATAGVRWSDTRRQEVQNLVQNLSPTGPTGLLPVEKASKENVVKRFRLAWDAGNDNLLYGMISEGFRVGGPNQPVGFNASAPGFDSDSLTNYEVGWKTAFLDKRLFLDVAAYFIDWSDVQYVTSDETGAFELIGNAGDAKVKGFEVDLQAYPAENFHIGVGIGYNHARFSGRQPVQGLLENQTEPGDRLPGVPDWSTVVAADYTVPLSGMEWQTGADWSYNSDRTVGLRPAAGNFRVLNGFHQVNLRTGLTTDRWEAWLRVDNLMDGQPAISGRIIDDTPFRYSTLRPRTFSLSVSFRY